MADMSSGADGASPTTLRRRMFVAGAGAAAGSMGVHAVATASRNGSDAVERDDSIIADYPDLLRFGARDDEY